jgi:hypothetical protein
VVEGLVKEHQAVQEDQAVVPEDKELQQTQEVQELLIKDLLVVVLELQ